MSEKNTPDGLRPGPVDNHRIASVDKRVIRKNPPPQAQALQKSLDERPN
jgi:hypothetical protein